MILYYLISIFRAVRQFNGKETIKKTAITGARELSIITSMGCLEDTYEQFVSMFDMSRKMSVI